MAKYSVSTYVQGGGLPAEVLGFRRPQKTKENQRKRAQTPHSRKHDHTHKGPDQPAVRRHQETTSRSNAFETCFFCAVLGPAPFLPCPHSGVTDCPLASLDTRKQVASLRASFCCSGTSLSWPMRHGTTCPSLAASASRTTALPMPRQIVDQSRECNWIEGGLPRRWRLC